LPDCSTISPRKIARRFRSWSKLPIIGPLFKSKAERAEQTELMVLITPRLVRALDRRVPAAPTRFKPFLSSPGKGGEGGDEFRAPARWMLRSRRAEAVRTTPLCKRGAETAARSPASDRPGVREQDVSANILLIGSTDRQLGSRSPRAA
jgi:Flp pilus assembly secretin CpaC